MFKSVTDYFTKTAREIVRPSIEMEGPERRLIKAFKEGGADIPISMIKTIIDRVNQDRSYWADHNIQNKITYGFYPTDASGKIKKDAPWLEIELLINGNKITIKLHDIEFDYYESN